MLFILQIDWSRLSFLGNEKVSSLLWCIGIIIVTMLIKKPLAKIVAKLSSAISNRFTDKRHSDIFCSLVQKPVELLLQTILFYIAINQLNILLSQFVLHRYKNRNNLLAIRFGDVADLLFMFFAILFATLLISRIIDFIYRVQQDKAMEEHNKERQQLLPLVKEVAKLILWTIGLFWIMGSVFQVNIPALITGLGIGGVAIALAAKESVENLFAAFTILSDKPFQTGDLVRLGSIEGNVERIGFRSTRLRNADGSAYIIPNKKLVNENLENLSARNMRRVKVTVNIKYGVRHEDLRKMMDELKKGIQQITHVQQPIEVLLDTFAENVFQLIITYHLPDPLAEGAKLNNIKQEVNLLTYEVLHKYVPSNDVSIQAKPAQEQEETGKTEENNDTGFI
jgi:MscS family membrane protein